MFDLVFACFLRRIRAQMKMASTSRKTAPPLTPMIRPVLEEDEPASGRSQSVRLYPPLESSDCAPVETATALVPLLEVSLKPELEL